MFISRRHGTTRAAAVALIATGATTFLTGNLLGTPSSAAPSSFIELDGNVRSDATLDWARSGGSSGTNGAFDGGGFVDATTPPTPPTATATLTGAPGFVADAFTVDPLDVDTTACGAGDSSVFTGQGGETNGDRIDGMTFATAPVPNKDDLSNVYAVVHRPTALSAEAFFGVERVRTDGDSHLDFELLHGTVTRAAGCRGTFAGSRSQGDLLVSVDFTNGGALAGTSVHQWHCADEADPQPADGTACDPPAHGPSVPHYEDVSAVPAIAAAVSVRVNDLAPVPCGGWACRAADGTEIASLPVNGLVEGGIDLSASGFAGCTATLLPHTRTAQSFTSTLKDFAGPVPIDVCATPVPVTTTTSTTTTTTTSTTTTTTTLAPTTTTTAAPVTTTTTLAPPTTTTLAPQTTTPTPAAPAPMGISARTIERPTTTTIAPQVLGVVFTAPVSQAIEELPRTGASTGPLLILAGLAMMVGGCLVLGARPRPHRPHRSHGTGGR